MENVFSESSLTQNTYKRGLDTERKSKNKENFFLGQLKPLQVKWIKI